MLRIRMIIFLFSFFLEVETLFAQFSGTTFLEAMQSKKATLVCVYSETPGYITSGDKAPVGVLPQIMSSFSDYVKKNNGIDITYNG